MITFREMRLCKFDERKLCFKRAAQHVSLSQFDTAFLTHTGHVSTFFSPPLNFWCFFFLLQFLIRSIIICKAASRAAENSHRQSTHISRWYFFLSSLYAAPRCCRDAVAQCCLAEFKCFPHSLALFNSVHSELLKSQEVVAKFSH